MRSKAKVKKAMPRALDSHVDATLRYWRLCLEESSIIESLNYSSKSDWIELPRSQVERGKFDSSLFTTLRERGKQSAKERRRVSESRDQRLSVVVSLLSASNSSGYPRNARNDLLLMPASLGNDGMLIPHTKLLPWIPREFLAPAALDTAPTISSVARVEKFFYSHPIHQIESYPELLRYAAELFRFATGSKVSEFSLAELQINDSCFITPFPDTQGGSRSLVQVLQSIVSGKRPVGLLGSLCKPDSSSRKLYQRSRYHFYRNAKAHIAHCSPDFPLSPSQRLALHRYLETPNGEVFSVNGPPGTGKTTVLQNFIANSWVQSALENTHQPPLLVVCGATNQSVGNVIDCFQFDSTADSLAERWLPGVSSYGSFCSSFSRAEQLEGYQVEVPSGEGFSSAMENFTYYRRAQEYFLQAASAKLGLKGTVVEVAKSLQRLLRDEVSQLQTELSRLLGLSFVDIFFPRFHLLDSAKQREIAEQTASLDVARRYRCFLLATHLWEARWLLRCSEELSRREAQGDIHTRPRFTPDDWRRRAMVSPVFVSTLAMVPKFFAPATNSEVLIDTLFFDEAGQVSPQMGAPLTSLAKRVVAIGDTAQLRPYSSMPAHIDVSLLQEFKLLTRVDVKSVGMIERAGLSATRSSLMQLVVNACRREDGQIIGASLEEHRRSVPRIVEFSNALAYRGRLRACREEPATRVFPPFAYVDVPGRAVRIGQSRRNELEAKAIVQFLEAYKTQILTHYAARDLGDIVAILTPFTAQARELENAIRRSYPTMIVGTVHSLQGAERPIVIFSATYDSQSRPPYVFDTDWRVLNVAVSRAKDSFLVFFDKRIFGDSLQEGSASALLARFLFSDERNQIELESTQQPVAATLPAAQRLSTLEQHQQILHYVLANAQNEVLIVSPTISIHAIEIDRIDELIKDARGRGVRVVVVTDATIDAPEGSLKPAAVEGRARLTEVGATLLVADRIHNKSLAMDVDLLVEGSFNWLSAVRTRESRNQKHETSYVTKGAGAEPLILALRQEMYGRIAKVIN